MSPGIEMGGIPESARNFRAPDSEPPPLTPRQELLQRKQAILDMGDIMSDDRRILEQPIFQPGEKVWVQRSDGKMEEGWEVVNTNKEGGVLVAKEGVLDPRTGKPTAATKRIKEAKLAELNP